MTSMPLCGRRLEPVISALQRFSILALRYNRCHRFHLRLNLIAALEHQERRRAA